MQVLVPQASARVRTSHGRKAKNATLLRAFLGLSGGKKPEAGDYVFSIEGVSIWPRKNSQGDIFFCTAIKQQQQQQQQNADLTTQKRTPHCPEIISGVFFQ